MNSQLIEIASWRIVSELQRRYPDKFKIIETHPGGGQYDCLSLHDMNRRHIADFNRQGRLHIFERFDKKFLPEPWDIWTDMFQTYDQKRILDTVSNMLGLPIPAKLPISTPTTLVYRFISEFLTHGAFGIHKLMCRNGYMDTSYDSCVSSDFKKFPEAQRRLAVILESDLQYDSAYRFWFLYRDKNPILCLETTGRVWTQKGNSFDLMDIYSLKRSIWHVISCVAGDVLP